ncbi:lasso peptide biosynthesis B2 protein [Evansella sp. AB-rgal1]|uniref:lasso peptide biosynthesis B2 protein n=1 Tax=Evansella sp. AB-rgal1 TaxID=3242696 RepID=UPI00359DCBF6
MGKKLRNFLSLPFWIKRLYFEAYWSLAHARVIKSFPFTRVVHKLKLQNYETSFDKKEDPAIKAIAKAIDVMQKYTFWESACLVQAIAAMKMLERRNIDSTLYLGTSKDKEGLMIAHAWLRSGSMYVTGGANCANFTVVSTFGKFVEIHRYEEGANVKS